MNPARALPLQSSPLAVSLLATAKGQRAPWQADRYMPIEGGCVQKDTLQ